MVWTTAVLLLPIALLSLCNAQMCPGEPGIQKRKHFPSHCVACTYFELVFIVAHFSQTYEEYNPPIYYAGSDFSFINISPRPSANDPLTGGDTLGVRCGELSNPPNTVQCLTNTSPFPPLVDGDLGPEGANYTNNMVHAWHRSTGTVTIEYTFDSGTITNPEIRHMNLYFYSNTSMGIGLPSVTMYRGSTVVEYHIFGNDDITQEDNMRRQILLSLKSTSSSRSYTLQFDFENTDVNWLVLSETRLCTVPLQGM